MPHGMCSVDDCNLGSTKRGYCIGHYTRWYRTGDPGPAALRVVRRYAAVWDLQSEEV